MVRGIFCIILSLLVRNHVKQQNKTPHEGSGIWIMKING